jgi:hypothetical protein
MLRRSRRAFVAGGLSAAAALVAGPPGASAAAPARGVAPVVILGAGIAGLTAALVLQDRGVRAS